MKRSSLKWLWETAGRHKSRIAALLVIQALLGIISVIFALALRSAIDGAAEKNRKVFFGALAGAAAIAAAQTAFRAVVRRLEESSRAGIENACKMRLFTKLMQKDYASVTAVHSGEWLSRLTSDSAVCAGGAVEILPGIAGMAVKMLGAVAMILVLEPRFAWILIPGGAVFVLLSYAFRRKLKRLHKNVQEKDGRLRIFLQERLENLLIIRSFSAEERSGAMAQERLAAHRAARMKKNSFSNVCNIGFAAAMHGMYLLGLGFCGYGIIKGSVSYGTLIAILQLIGQVQSPIANITGFLPRFYAMTASAERLMEAESFPDDCPEDSKTSGEVRSFYNSELAALGFAGASFSYHDAEDKSVLNDMSFEIEKCGTIAFTGRSGCGKSTILKLLMCLYPLDGGKRYILKKDGTKQELTSGWHRLFAYVPQGNQLMSGTVAEAVTFGCRTGEYDAEKLRYALEIACADEFVHELEGGTDYLLGERGQGLSEGQMQRLAIARAVFSEAPVLLLDEATSALDEETEKRLLQNLKTMTDKTVLIVTHRPAALEICGKVIAVSDHGIEVKNEKNRL